VVRGDTFIIDIDIKDHKGNTKDLRGYTFTFTVKKSPSDSTPIIRVEEHVPEDAPNKVEVVSLKADTSVIEQPGVYVYDIQYKDPQDNVRTPLLGKLYVIEDITK
jgi:uncharacterized membrane protein YkoI